MKSYALSGMKRLLLFALSLSCILSACHPAVKKPVVIVQTAYSPHFASWLSYHDTLLMQYDRFLISLDSADLQAGRTGFEKFRQLFTGRPEALCDTAYCIYEEFHLRLGATLEERRAKDMVNLENLVELRGDSSAPPPLTPQVLKIKKDLTANGYIVETDGEGGTYISRSFAIMSKQFGPYVTPAMKSWLEEFAREQQ